MGLLPLLASAESQKNPTPCVGTQLLWSLVLKLASCILTKTPLTKSVLYVTPGKSHHLAII